MMELNIDLMFGFLIWSALCLLLVIVQRIRSNYWKRDAMYWSGKAGDLQNEINRRDQRLWDSIPKGVITHAKKQQ
jgi:hypothetical protein